MIDQQIPMARDLFNRAWELLDRTDRTPEDDLRMLRKALGSRAMWRKAGGPSGVSRE